MTQGTQDTRDTHDTRDDALTPAWCSGPPSPPIAWPPGRRRSRACTCRGWPPARAASGARSPCRPPRVCHLPPRTLQGMTGARRHVSAPPHACATLAIPFTLALTHGHHQDQGSQQLHSVPWPGGHHGLHLHRRGHCRGAEALGPWWWFCGAMHFLGVALKYLCTVLGGVVAALTHFLGVYGSCKLFWGALWQSYQFPGEVLVAPRHFGGSL